MNRYKYQYLIYLTILEILSLGYFGMIFENVPGTYIVLGNLVTELDNGWCEVGSVSRCDGI